jgi:hypothetical protein
LGRGQGAVARICGDKYTNKGMEKECGRKVGKRRKYEREKVKKEIIFKNTTF